MLAHTRRVVYQWLQYLVYHFAPCSEAVAMNLMHATTTAAGMGLLPNELQEISGQGALDRALAKANLPIICIPFAFAVRPPLFHRPDNSS